MRKLILTLILALVFLPVAMADLEVETIESARVLTTTVSTGAPETYGSLRVLSTNYEPTPAEPGNFVTVWIAAQNFGEKEIKNAAVKLFPPYPFSLKEGDDGIRDLALLPAFRERLFEYDLLVDEDAVEGTYDMTLGVCKDTTCEELIKKTKIEVTVKTGGEPRVEIGLEDSEILSAGKTGEVTLNAVNRGKLDVRFLVIEVMPSEEFDIITPPRKYIGDLESDDFETETFKIYIKPEVGLTETQQVEMLVAVDYSDENYKEYQSIEKVIFNVYSQEDLQTMGLAPAASNGMKFVYIVVIAVIAFLGYRWWKKKKDKD